ncbi:hypothetical protein J437_LFUL006582 [Ladona fulva]|uniref:Uncharacterized protein n=1 Tax=Ladona fulva TaxID=123851 RepID=A0A8K0K6G7_LADFU|nr:hypothetical protein J437_LFUL006582 [Ladona fulva]
MNRKEINSINILVISPFQFRQTLIDALVKENIVGDCDYKLTISSCESVEEIGSFHQDSEESPKKYLFDYIVLVVDAILRFGLQKAEKEISLIPNYYFTTRRTFFISSDTLNLDYGFYELYKKYKCPAVVGDILEPKGCASIARRALKLIEFSGGMNSGLPFLGLD